jgi:hypothetical protein
MVKDDVETISLLIPKLKLLVDNYEKNKIYVIE